MFKCNEQMFESNYNLNDFKTGYAMRSSSL